MYVLGLTLGRGARSTISRPAHHNELAVGWPTASGDLRTLARKHLSRHKHKVTIIQKSEDSKSNQGRSRNRPCHDHKFASLQPKVQHNILHYTTPHHTTPHHHGILRTASLIEPLTSAKGTLLLTISHRTRAREYTSHFCVYGSPCSS
jgi:hypothetical protein